VRILTNSLAGTDEVSVHSGYARRRKDLLRAGVQLLEIKPSAAPILQRGEEIGKHSTAGLHARLRRRPHTEIFVGSFNFDPALGQAEHRDGLVIESASLPAAVAVLDERLPCAGLPGDAGARRVARLARRPRRDADDEARTSWAGGSRSGSSPGCRSNGCSETA
jgi:phosphatidylserine/phosphatidylglycerophosphate/cardiolipin synthase-like enzyme